VKSRGIMESRGNGDGKRRRPKRGRKEAKLRWVRYSSAEELLTLMWMALAAVLSCDDGIVNAARMIQLCCVVRRSRDHISHYTPSRPLASRRMVIHTLSYSSLTLWPAAAALLLHKDLSSMRCRFRPRRPTRRTRETLWLRVDCNRWSMQSSGLTRLHARGIAVPRRLNGSRSVMLWAERDPRDTCP